ncbi:cupin domain-containing protein [Campylobacter geochelonis]|uniref:Uncharacterized conserved protein, contains double-stranded beta-helix domain n=1 Tax=Campylobacter geochelonis TaxID=1780362 RepID=A0A128ELJ8_9BACT|nr:cupin domain-containing protein [Campylobacter geochelonis]QKF71688.1 Cupin domain-containing protein [Campylobacter geochelonis]CZE49212.1 Uncharacterized conserved protein%2C contains double-stranded beta-helix domain [Campylobacter geochelonis]CZE49238.1 Uncharacterized conserved protein%2C contains double-stranded beta-helix domain [Campylobacter geochelonis]CZE51306.1 Uncharacterized conserved protein%2C contains double-stranded beta-helix domain [Campylobacter geochelonis]
MYLKDEFVWSDIPKTDGAKIAVLTPQSDNDFIVRKIVLKSGGFMPNHINKIQHQQFVLKGEAKVIIDGKEIHAKAGEFLYIPGGVSHSYEACFDKDYEFLCMIPKKDDEIEFL